MAWLFLKKAMPSVKIVTSIHTICDAIVSNEVFKDMLPAVHKLLQLYETIPITCSTAERMFSTMTEREAQQLSATICSQKIHR